jgi:hypothetical protein
MILTSDWSKGDILVVVGAVGGTWLWDDAQPVTKTRIARAADRFDIFIRLGFLLYLLYPVLT